MQKYEGRPFVLLGVDEDVQRETLQKTEKKYQLTWRSWWDSDNVIVRRWDVDAYPTFFLVDHNGITRWRSGSDLNLDEMERLIERLVKEAESEGGRQASRNRDR